MLVAYICAALKISTGTPASRGPSATAGFLVLKWLRFLSQKKVKKYMQYAQVQKTSTVNSSVVLLSRLRVMSTPYVRSVQLICLLQHGGQNDIKQHLATIKHVWGVIKTFCKLTIKMQHSILHILSFFAIFSCNISVLFFVQTVHAWITIILSLSYRASTTIIGDWTSVNRVPQRWNFGFLNRK